MVFQTFWGENFRVFKDEIENIFPVVQQSLKTEKIAFFIIYPIEFNLNLSSKTLLFSKLIYIYI